MFNPNRSIDSGPVLAGKIPQKRAKAGGNTFFPSKRSSDFPGNKNQVIALTLCRREDIRVAPVLKFQLSAQVLG